MLNRTCLACGKKYEYCGSCPTSANLPVWKNIFDTENCKTIFENTSDFVQGVISKDVAKNRISKCDFSIKYKDNIQKHINNIMAEPKIEKIMEDTEEIISIRPNSRKSKTKISD